VRQGPREPKESRNGNSKEDAPRPETGVAELGRLEAEAAADIDAMIKDPRLIDAMIDNPRLADSVSRNPRLRDALSESPGLVDAVRKDPSAIDRIAEALDK
jgi:hypothetical protein